MSHFNSVIVDESKNIIEESVNNQITYDGEQVSECSNELYISEESNNISEKEVNDIHNQMIDLCKISEENNCELKFTNEINKSNDQVNNIVKPVLSISLPDSPKEIENVNTEIFKPFNDIQKKNNDVINSVGNEITKKIENIKNIEEISCSKKKNKWLWWLW
jgi:hypothetical protein